jgi:sarcosine oxidase
MPSAPAFDVIVAGLGAMGSTTLAQLARRGLRVAGFDRFAPPHALGSSHGRSRIIREAYYEDPRYVPLVQRAYAAWAELEAQSGAALLRRTGGVCYGPPDGTLVTGARRSAETHGLPHEILDADGLRRAYPVLRPDPSWIGVVEPRAGMLAPERCIAAALDVAERAGATVRRDEAVTGWHPDGDGVRVETGQGTYRAARLVLSTGAWMRETLGDLHLPLVVQRNVLYWFAPARDAGAFAPERFPVFLGDLGDGTMWYGFPDTGDGVKVAMHHHGPTTSPEGVDRTVAEDEVAAMRGRLARYLPAANGPLRETATCLYTNTPDGHFVLDRHPAAPQVVLASPCSGHGFKFASAMGEVLADLAMDRPPAFDLSLFTVGRFAARV